MAARELRRHADDPQTVGSYSIEGRLGRGGQGVVYLARADDGQLVALKMLFLDWAGDGVQAKVQLQSELQAARKVRAFCTARVLASDLDADPPYIVSEYIEGDSLYDRVRDRGPFPEGDLERLAVGTATALTAIHHAGVVHRDFKPGNVMLGPDGPRVIDFGIARALDLTATLTGRMVGTPAYMAPEQFSAEPVGPPADVFAWGATITFAAGGSPPFEASSAAAVMSRILRDEPDLSKLPAHLRSLVAECLAKDPQRRPQAQEVLLRLLPPGPPETPKRPLTVSLVEGAEIAETGVLTRTPTTRKGRTARTLGGGRQHTAQTRVSGSEPAVGQEAGRPVSPPDLDTDALPVVRPLRVGDPVERARFSYFAAARAERKGEPDRAERLLRQAMTRREGYWPGAAAISLGNLLRTAGVSHGAAETYQSVLSREGSDLKALAYVNLARLWLQWDYSYALWCYRAAEATGDTRYGPVAARERQRLESGHLPEVASGRRLLPSLAPPRAFSLYAPVFLLVLLFSLLYPPLAFLGLPVCGLGVLSVARNQPHLVGRRLFLIGLAVSLVWPVVGENLYVTYVYGG